MNKSIALANIKLTGPDKGYYKGQLQRFANNTTDDVVRVEFGRQDIRGGISICYYNDRHCVSKQDFFHSKDEMLGYVCGHNVAEGVQHAKI